MRGMRYAVPMKRGFSLVELSIVLVILGLLVGGILAGQSLIRASELRAVSTEYQQWTTATNAFRDKYFALPGDFRDATRFWGRMNSNADCITRSSASVASPGACDGVGDGAVNSAAAASQSGERFQFWLHLNRAGMIPGDYTGIAGTGGGEHTVIGVNAPASKLSNGGWGVGAWDNSGGGGASFNAFNFGNYYSLGRQDTGGWPWNNLLKPEEAWNLDTKLDDGKPATGKMMTNWMNCTTAANLNDFTGSYALTSTANQCTLMFVRQF